MRFLTDQDLYALTVRFLRDRDHDVVTADEAGLGRAADVTLLERAAAEERILITRDRDFGTLAFAVGLGTGVIYLRMTPKTVDSVHKELAAVLDHHSESELREAFVVVEPGRHRFRRLPRLR